MEKRVGFQMSVAETCRRLTSACMMSEACGLSDGSACSYCGHTKTLVRGDWMKLWQQQPKRQTHPPADSPGSNRNFLLQADRRASAATVQGCT